MDPTNGKHSSSNSSTDVNGTAPGQGGGGGTCPPDASLEQPHSSEDFLQTGRTGRRNALPDILSTHSNTSTADLSDKMSALSTAPTEPGGGPNDYQSAGPSSASQ